MARCKLCIEKQTEIERILKGYRGDKKTWQKKEKRYQIAIIAITGLLLLVTAFGVKGLLMGIDLIKNIFS